MSLAHLRQRLCWQGRMTTGLENSSRQTGQTSCFSRFSMVAPPPAPGPELPAEGGLRAKFITSQGSPNFPHNVTRRHFHLLCLTSDLRQLPEKWVDSSEVIYNN
ncbi:hypothetical protein EYF80_004404 [Liparis tanakae]|uniref:Uncharacterized protein n=1 Tax=Liparis tanakae TaxID=230148 RepID=A0A4Z2J7H1_9TELE|nr:hypothetical protein EYF80_004404 [Liparis tanakae]